MCNWKREMPRDASHVAELGLVALKLRFGVGNKKGLVAESCF